MDNIKQYQRERNIICVDLKSFYASVECILRGLDPFKTPLVVADKKRGDGTICLAVTPYLKEQGLPSVLRVFEIPKDIDVIYAKPQMKKYIEYSTKVIEVYLKYVSIDDLYIYSIDEAFLDVTRYLKMYKMTDIELAKRIKKDVFDTLGLSVSVGVGPNMLLSKLAMDIEGKKTKDNIAKWHYKDVESKLWPVTPLSKMWGIGRRMEKRLNLLGLHKIGDIANYSKSFLKRQFGILGEELYYHTHGIDLSEISDKEKLFSKTKSFSSGQVLDKDYSQDEILTVLLEMTDEVTTRLRLFNKQAKTISLSIGYSKHYGGGFSHQLTLYNSTNLTSVVYKEVISLFDKYYEGYPIRRVGISLSNLVEATFYQLSIDSNYENMKSEESLFNAIDLIKIKHGKNAIYRTTSKQKHATAIRRNNQIGGHNV